jgi:hypothetical protein
VFKPEFFNNLWSQKAIEDELEKRRVELGVGGSLRRQRSGGSQFKACPDK